MYVCFSPAVHVLQSGTAETWHSTSTLTNDEGSRRTRNINTKCERPVPYKLQHVSHDCYPNPAGEILRRDLLLSMLNIRRTIPGTKKIRRNVNDFVNVKYK